MIVALLALKGGVGKSTLSFHLGAEWARLGRRVVVLDCDPQATMASLAETASFPFPVLPHVLGDDGAVAPWVRTVRAADADIVLLDLPPALAGAAEAAAVVADVCVVPVRASVGDFRSLKQTLALLSEARRVRGDGGPRALLVPSSIDRRTAGGRETAGALEGLGEAVGPVIAQRAAYADAFAAGVSVSEWSGVTSPAAYEVAELAAVIEGMGSGKTA